MPPSSSSKASRPGVLAWFGFAVLVLVILAVIKMAFQGATGAPDYEESRTSAFRSSISSGIPSMDVGEAMPAAPSAAPLPQEMRKGGSAVAKVDAAKPVQRVIKVGELTLRVTDASKAVEDVRAYVSSKNGFVESSTISDPGAGPRSAKMTIRVPVQSFDETMRDLKHFAVLTLEEEVGGQDVTMEFVDLDADLRNAKAEESSYLEILKRSGDIPDVLAVTERLADVRGRIERLEGRKRYLENLTDLATISLSLTEETRVELPGRTWKPLEVLRESLRDLVESLQGLVDFLIRLVIAVVGLLLPIALIVWLIMWLGWKIVKRVMRTFRK